jgi:hypothetical protein
VEVVPMYGLTRATLTLIGVLVAGSLIWLSSRIFFPEPPNTARYWTFAGLLAAAGLVIALSQLLGGWTKWGWPRVSMNVFLLAFVPTLILGGWVLAASEPGNGSWLATHTRTWSDDLGIRGFVRQLGYQTSAIAFGIGLVFGLTFDTTGRRVVRAPDDEEKGAAGNGKHEKDQRVRIRESGEPVGAAKE